MQMSFGRGILAQGALRSIYVTLALSLLLSTLGPSSLVQPGDASAAGPALYPDLKTTRPSGLYFDRVTMSDGLSHYVLRFSNTVWNDGEGRLELQGDPRPDGSSKVYQNVYDSPSSGTRVSQRHVSSDIVYHPSHYHYHFQGFASYLMLKRDSAGVYQATTKKGSKTGFCIMDSNRISSRGSSYAKYSSCNGSLQGISVGWGDLYQGSLPEQWIDLGTTRLADGYYAIQSTADPQNKLSEGGRDNNNVGLTYFRVSNGSITIGSAPPVVSNPPGTMNPVFSGSALAPTRSWGSSNGSGSPYVRDGSWSTAWYTVSSPSSGSFTIDYGQVRQLTGVRWGFNVSGYADQFTVDTSVDGQSWSRVGTFGNGQRYTWYGIRLGRQGRYVRVTFANPNGDAKLGYMAELQLWGTSATVSAAGMPTPTPTSTTSVSAARVTAPTPGPSPTATPTPEPTATPTTEPTATPTPEPTATPTTEPTATPTPEPTTEPTATPTSEPTIEPTPEPTAEPTATLAPEPTATALPATEEPTPTPTEVVVAVTGTGYIVNDGNGANCRPGPSQDGEPITVLPEGTQITTFGDPVDGWQEVSCGDEQGYVRAEFISENPPPAEPTPEQDADPTEGAEVTTPAPDETDVPEATSEVVPTDEPTIAETPELVLEQRTIEVATSGDTSVTQSEPDTAQSGDAVTTLTVGGEPGGLAVLPFEVEGVGDGTVVEARLVLTGAGDAGGAGGEVTALPGVSLDEYATTWNTINASGGQYASWVEWVEPGARTEVDVTGLITSDGSITFVVEGVPDQQVAIASTESRSPAYLVITVETASGDPVP